MASGGDPGTLGMGIMAWLAEIIRRGAAAGIVVLGIICWMADGGDLGMGSLGIKASMAEIIRRGAAAGN